MAATPRSSSSSIVIATLKQRKSEKQTGTGARSYPYRAKGIVTFLHRGKRASLTFSIYIFSLQWPETSLSHLAKTRKKRVSPLLLPSPGMPAQHFSLGSISGNRQFNSELTPYTRGKFVGLSLKGAKLMKIQDLLKITCSALYSTLSLDHLYEKGIF